MMVFPGPKKGQRTLLRSLMNTREPEEISTSFLSIQDEYLKEEIEERE